MEEKLYTLIGAEGLYFTGTYEDIEVILRNWEPGYDGDYNVYEA